MKEGRRIKPGKKASAQVLEVMRWFRRMVTYEDEAYAIDAEQAEAVVDMSLNTIVVARAGSGKTRTIVAKIVYLIARCGVKPEEIMAFVFNANAAKEINERLAKMRVEGVPIIRGNDDVVTDGGGGDAVGRKLRVATTFHAFARKIVYEACGGREKCGKILAGEKEAFIWEVVRRMMIEKEWRKKIIRFVKGNDVKEGGDLAEKQGEDIAGRGGLDEKEIERFAKMMAQFVNRAQQKYLGGEKTVGEVAREYLKRTKVDARERVFIELGVECFKRYHWYLLDARDGLMGFSEYGTDFNLIVSWASKLINAERGSVREWLGRKKWILIDEYQDFSQLFLAAVEAIRGVTKNARLFVVGDDLQAINRFAGSEVEYFKEFERFFPEDCRRLPITTNYRCDRMVVGMARKFMMRGMGEKGEFRAFSRRVGKVIVVDPRGTECRVPMTDADLRVSGEDLLYAQVVRKMVGRIPKATTVKYVKSLAEVIRKNRRFQEILILHRNNVTEIEGVSLVKLSHGLREILALLKIMDFEEYDAKVRMMTMHKSKGLEAEVVIILEADEGVIPKLHPDTRLYGMFGETDKVALADQKRLFYVAMTRAKRRLYIMHESSGGAGFVKYLGRGVERWE